MVPPKLRTITLWVKAMHNAEVREIDEHGRPLLGFIVRHVGRDDQNNVIPEGVMIPYHPHYIARIKEGDLLPMDLATAVLAGVAWNPELIMQ